MNQQTKDRAARYASEFAQECGLTSAQAINLYTRFLQALEEERTESEQPPTPRFEIKPVPPLPAGFPGAVFMEEASPGLPGSGRGGRHSREARVV